MGAIFKREFKSYFTTPIGYVVLAAFYFFLGILFVNTFSAGAPEGPMIIIAMSQWWFWFSLFLQCVS